SADDTETLATIRASFEQEDYLVDPHTAVGISVGNRFRTAEIPLLYLSTAHPAKFEDAISRAVPGLVPHHERLEALKGLPTRMEKMGAEVNLVQAFIRQHGLH
ncbi:MAG: threonine synthase, partial [Proteobacteria bacterium]|nr:threonine synthase [Pseudomonadota bacterium]